MADDSANQRLPDPETIELFLALARERLTGLERAWEAHRTKAGFILAADALIISHLNEVAMRGPNALFPLLILAAGGAGGCAIVAIWPKDVHTGGNITKYLATKSGEAKADVLPHLAVHYAHAVDKNDEASQETGRTVKFALGFLAAALGLYGAIMTNVF